MNVVKELLDKPVVDRDGRPMGRVDGIVGDVRAGEPMRLAAILIGPSVLAERLHPRLGRWVAALERRCGLDAGRPVRVALADVTDTHRKISLRLRVGDTAVDAVERKIRGWLSRLPGSR